VSGVIGHVLEPEEHPLASKGRQVHLLLNPHILQAGAILAGGGLSGIDRGYEAYRRLYLGVREAYLRRCDMAGFPRRDRCLMPPDPPF
jgi:hypothetical protein